MNIDAIKDGFLDWGYCRCHVGGLINNSAVHIDLSFSFTAVDVKTSLIYGQCSSAACVHLLARPGQYENTTFYDYNPLFQEHRCNTVICVLKMFKSIYCE
jgi:hypothetical protein